MTALPQPQTAPFAAPPACAGRWTPARLARLSLISGLVSPVLLYGVGFVSIFLIMDDSGSLHRDLPWLPWVVMGFGLIGLLLPPLALVTGLSAFLRLHWVTETRLRLAALVGFALGGLFTLVTVLPNLVDLLQLAYQFAVSALAGQPL